MEMFSEQLEQKEKEQSILLELSTRIAAARRREDLWNVITDQLLELFNSRYYTICMLNEDGATHTPFLHSQESTISSRTGETPIMADLHPVEDGVFNIVLSAEGPVVFELQKVMKGNKVPPYVYRWFNVGVVEMLAVRICNGNQPKGLLYLFTEKKNAFVNVDDRFVRAIADMLGIGISNILANETIERQLLEIERFKQRLENENRYLQEEQGLQNTFADIIGGSAEIQERIHILSRVAPSESTVLLLGETGTGKEVFARAIHAASPRKEHLMIKVNCAALPPNLIESELFGHEKGSFTGATQRRIGKFELADNSTLFLDEIGELPLEFQSKLLRVLQEKEIERIGGKSTIKVNVRIIAATNRNLEEEVRAGRFRSDLYYRLHVFPIAIPALRQRKSDIPALAAHFLQRFAARSRKQAPTISAKAMESLVHYDWPGNVRELEHLMERTLLLTTTPVITKIPLPGVPVSAAKDTESTAVLPLNLMEKEYILKVLRLCNGRIAGPNGAAAKLKLPSTTLNSRMKKLGIKKAHYISSEEPEMPQNDTFIL
ncbi:sigma 54-interacting transcriptional regulator [Chitinophaga rhizophila]|uniref:Sigma 54-interacting transcriptional regulator n=1 Tax=Chitinophaga rhizophila TaxID=2866212 RepID=A0ABS7GI68_9BACT|nr:sigma 54-interacting transcriptional regulator [Chitinophaga rhizophila]MBW8687398.1 sigma 54-interacting transcriptional regulator [Chitinophaga rhizophila]